MINNLKWFGTFLFLCAGLILSLNIEISRYGFFIFLVGHATFIYIFAKEKDTPMVVQNLAFALIDVSGIYRWFLV